MPRKNAARYLTPDSIGAKPDDSQLLTSIFSSGIVQVGGKARKWYKYSSYIATFTCVSAEKWRRRFNQLLNESVKIKQNTS